MTRQEMGERLYQRLTDHYGVAGLNHGLIVNAVWDALESQIDGDTEDDLFQRAIQKG